MSNDKTTYYTGMTKNPRVRFNQHQKGQSKYTRRFKGNLFFGYLEKIECDTQKKAEQQAWAREKQIKKWTHDKKSRLIIKNRYMTQKLLAEYVWKAMGKKTMLEMKASNNKAEIFIDNELIKSYKKELEEYEIKINNIKAQIQNTLQSNIPLLDIFIIDSTNNVPSTYFIQCETTGAIKIGFSVNPRKRIKSFEAASPLPVRCVGLIKSGKSMETKLHIKFKGYHLHYEWFINGKDLISFIEKYIG